MESNFPKDLTIKPSTSLQTPSTLDSESFQQSAFSSREDIIQYGIAGRTWEASHFLNVYLQTNHHTESSLSSLESPSNSDIDIKFDPPCPLFDDPNRLKTTRSSNEQQQHPLAVLDLGSGNGHLGFSLARRLGLNEEEEETSTHKSTSSRETRLNSHPTTTTTWRRSSRRSVILTDLEEVIPLLEKNLQLCRKDWNLSLQNINILPLEWGNNYHIERILKNNNNNNNKILNEIEIEIDVIVCSDLVYFRFLFEPLLRTLIKLTEPIRRGFNNKKEVSQRQKDSKEELKEEEEERTPTVILGSKIRKLEIEQEFWRAFGRFFDFEPVLINRNDGSDIKMEPYGQEDNVFVFIARRRLNSLGIEIPPADPAGGFDLLNWDCDGRLKDGFERFDEIMFGVMDPFG